MRSALAAIEDLIDWDSSSALMLVMPQVSAEGEQGVAPPVHSALIESEAVAAFQTAPSWDSAIQLTGRICPLSALNEDNNHDALW
jgi:hypothetical protein